MRRAVFLSWDLVSRRSYPPSTLPSTINSWHSTLAHLLDRQSVMPSHFSGRGWGMGDWE